MLLLAFVFQTHNNSKMETRLWEGERREKRRDVLTYGHGNVQRTMYVSLHAHVFVCGAHHSTVCGLLLLLFPPRLCFVCLLLTHLILCWILVLFLSFCLCCLLLFAALAPLAAAIVALAAALASQTSCCRSWRNCSSCCRLLLVFDLQAQGESFCLKTQTVIL